jgi:hypothetical protein
VKKQLGILVGSVAGLWAMSAITATLVGLPNALLQSALAAVICLVPTAATLIWGHWAIEQSPQQQMLMVLGGTGVRMAAVLGAGALLYFSLAGFHTMAFWGWILLFYLVTLALENVLLLSRTNRTVLEKSCRGQNGESV